MTNKSYSGPLMTLAHVLTVIFCFLDLKGVEEYDLRL